MTYAQFHDGFYRNAKVKRAGSMGAWMWAASIGYANENLTDGFVPLECLNELTELDSKPRLKLAARLVEVGLWEVAEGGWRIHDFLKWNFSREQVLARREANLARVNKHRGKGAKASDGNQRVTHYNDRYGDGDEPGDAGRDERGESRGEKRPSSDPLILGSKNPPPKNSVSRERADAPAKAPPSDPDEGPPAQKPNPRTDEDDKSQAPTPEAPDSQPDEAPRKFPRPYIVPPAGSVDLSILAVIRDAAKGRFDELSGGVVKQRLVAERLRLLGVTEAVGAEMGVLFQDAKKLWPRAKGLDASGRVSLSYLLGKQLDDGSYGCEWLGDAVGQARASLARKAQEAATTEARRLAAAAAQSQPPRALATPADAAAARPSFARVAPPTAPIEAEEMTHG